MGKLGKNGRKQGGGIETTADVCNSPPVSYPTT
jgi:hypothetical protein